MKILIAPNSMKGSLNAFEFADIVENSFLRCSDQFEVRKIPVADGGDHTGPVLSRALNAQQVHISVKNPLGDEITSVYSKSGNIAIIEMADASGMKLIHQKHLNPMKASSFGTGQLINHAIKNGCSTIYLGIGGSATVDGGSGMLEALGFQFVDKNGRKLAGNGGSLELIDRVIEPDGLIGADIKIICDVKNPLLGKNGAAKVFGPQKGANDKMVVQLENGLKNWCKILELKSGKKLSGIEGAGAAGGIALPLMVFYGAKIKPGADFILSVLNFSEHVKWADLVITGEGKIDGQTLNNKAPMAVAQVARKLKKPVVAFGGNVQPNASRQFDGIFSIINQPCSLELAIKNAPELLSGFAFEFATFLYNLKLK